MDLVIWFK